MKSEGADEQYFARIEEHFGRRRNGPLVLSPKDWRLLEEWHETGIPLRIVLRGINQAFDRFTASGPRPDRINSLRYCEQEVQAAWQDYRSAQRGGKQGDLATTGLPTASAHLRVVSEACRAAAGNADKAAAAYLTAAAAELDELERAAEAGTMGARSIDRNANALETRLHEELESLSADTAPPQLPPFSPYGI